MKTLEIIIALSFVFLILSLLATVIQELISSAFSLRGKMLIKTLAQMLEIPEGRYFKFFKWTLKRDCINYRKLMRRQRLGKRLPSYLTHRQLISILHDLLNKDHFYIFTTEKYLAQRNRKWFYKLIKFLGGVWKKRKWFYKVIKFLSGVWKTIIGQDQSTNLTTRRRKNENYLAEESEHQILLFPERINDNRLRNALNQLRQDAESYDNPNVKITSKARIKAERDIAHTYDEIMERSAGWYKRQTQFILVFIGLFIAFTFDADTFKIYDRIISDPSARKEVIELAERFVDNQNFPTTNDSTTLLQQQLTEILTNDLKDLKGPLGLGWQEMPDFEQNKDENKFKTYFSYLGKVYEEVIRQLTIKKIIGFLCTALAISLGASFWFDTLKLLINIRNAGRRPDSLKDKKDKDVIKVVVPPNRNLIDFDDEDAVG